MLKNKLYIISGASGVGKSTIINRLLVNHAEIKQAISHTTRNKREHEIDGVHYHFITREKFDEYLSKDEFLAHTNMFGNSYGVLKETVQELLAYGHVFLDLNPAWLQKVKLKIQDCVSLFILPPNPKVLENRLHKRGDVSETINTRMQKVAYMNKFSVEYDYVIINEEDKLEDSVNNVIDIIQTNNPAFRTFQVALTNDIFSRNGITEPFTYLAKIIIDKPHLISQNFDKISVKEVVGWNNISFRITESANQDYVIRIPRQNCGHIANYHEENKNSNLVQKYGHDAKIHYFDTNLGLKIAEFIPNTGTLDNDKIKNNKKYIQLVAIKLSEIHSINETFTKEAEPHQSTLKLYDLVKNRIPQQLQEIEKLILKANKAYELLEKSNQIKVPCHMDPTPYNILVKDEQIEAIEIIDWENSGMFDYCWDLANFITQAELTAEETNYFIDCYKVNLLQLGSSLSNHVQQEKNLLSRIELYKPLVELWLIIFIKYQQYVVENKTVLSDDLNDKLETFGEYRFNKTKNYFDSPNYSIAYMAIMDSVSSKQLSNSFAFNSFTTSNRREQEIEQNNLPSEFSNKK